MVIRHPKGDPVINLINSMKRDKLIKHVGYENTLISYFEILNNPHMYNTENATKEIVCTMNIWLTTKGNRETGRKKENEISKEIKSWFKKIL